MKDEKTLTDDEKMKCTVKWLNTLYRAWIKKEEVKIPCTECRHFGKECSKNDPPQANFKVLEQFTGEGSIISPLADQENAASNNQYDMETRIQTVERRLAKLEQEALTLDRLKDELAKGNKEFDYDF